MVRKIFSKIKRRYQKWKTWKQYTWYGPIKRIFVFLGLKKSFYFDSFMILEDTNKDER